MADRDHYQTRVQEVLPLSTHLKRIVLQGGDLGTFPIGFEGGYVKLILPEGRSSEPNRLARTRKRSFTVRAFDQRARRLTLDFALHETQGPALRWATAARPGDAIQIAGPGPVQMLNLGASWFLLAGDMTALPAISVNLERLPEDAQGQAIIEVPAQEDILDLERPSGIAIQWVVTPASVPSALVESVRSVPWPDEDRVSAWAACEFTAMKALRRYLADERSVPKDSLYVSSYWKKGATDEEHKIEKAAELT